MTGKLFEQILLTRALSKLLGLWFFAMTSFVSDPNTVLHYVERLTTEFRIKRLSGVAFLAIIKAFDTIFFDGPNYKLATNNFPSYLLDIYLPAYMVGSSKCPSKQPHSMVRHGDWRFSGWNNFPRPV